MFVMLMTLFWYAIKWMGSLDASMLKNYIFVMEHGNRMSVLQN